VDSVVTLILDEQVRSVYVVSGL